jgi:short subunit fatty acids transporter
MLATPTPLEAVRSGATASGILSFGMQMTLVMFSLPVAVSPPVDRTEHSPALRARRAAVLGMALFSMGLAWVHWGISIVGADHGAARARALPRSTNGCSWPRPQHGDDGTRGSASALLLVATRALPQQMGIVPPGDDLLAVQPALMAVVAVAIAVLVRSSPRPGRRHGRSNTQQLDAKPASAAAKDAKLSPPSA